MRRFVNNSELVFSGTGFSGVGRILAIPCLLMFVLVGVSSKVYAEPLGLSWKEPKTGMEFVYVKGGCFKLGCDTWFSECRDDEKPAHEVCVNDFYMGKFEVTQGQWKKIMGDNPAEFQKGDNYPVERISWHEAQEFNQKLSAGSDKNFRLPTEAEWEYAARSGGKKQEFAGSNNIHAVAWFRENSSFTTHPVGERMPNALGLYDMSGNVWEWCQDWYDEDQYSNNTRMNPAGPDMGLQRVFRGGSWTNSARLVRTAKRSWASPDYRFINLGFRVVFSPPSAN